MKKMISKVLTIILGIGMLSVPVRADVNELLLLDRCTFNGNNIWNLYTAEESKAELSIREYNDYCFNMTVYKGLSGCFYQLDKFEDAFINDKMVLESDFMISGTKAQYQMFVLRFKNEAQHNVDIDIVNGKMAGRTISVGKWHHIKYVLDIKNRRSEAYLDYETTPIITNNSIKSDGTFGGIRMLIKNQTDTSTLSLDNITVSTVAQRTQLDNISMCSLASGGTTVGSAEQTDYAVFNFTRPLDFDTVKKENIKIFSENGEYPDYDVYCDKSDTYKMYVFFPKVIEENAIYTVDTSRIRDMRGLALEENEHTIFFGNESNAVKQWKVYLNGEAVYGTPDIAVGDKLKLYAEFNNAVLPNKKHMLILAVYDSRGKVVSTAVEEITDGAVSAATEEITVSAQDGDEVCIKGFLWEGDVLYPADKNMITYAVAGAERKELAPDFSGFTEIYDSLSLTPSEYLSGSENAIDYFSNTVCFVCDSEYIFGMDRKYRTFEKAISLNGRIAVKKTVLDSMFPDCVINSNVTDDGYVFLDDTVRNDLGLYYAESEKGIGVLSAVKLDLKASKIEALAKEMIRYIALLHPTSSELRQTAWQKAHPKLLDEDLISQRLASGDAKVEELSNVLLFQCKNIQLSTPTATPTSTGGYYGMDAAAVWRLYWAYRVTGDTSYADTAIEHAMKMTEWSHWQSTYNFLQTAHAMVACSYVYDLFNDRLTASQKKALATAIIEKGLKPAQMHYYGRGSSDWPLRITNWNLVCNAGVIIAALAVGNDYETELCYDALEKALRSVGYAMTEYAPDGGWYEGVGYSNFIASYFIPALMSLENVYGTCFGVADVPGFKDNRYFPFYMTATEDKFNLCDDLRNNKLLSSFNMWMAHYYGDDELIRLRQREIVRSQEYRITLLDLLYYNEGWNDYINAPLDVEYQYAGIAESRSSWYGDANWIGVHAGDNSVSHGQIDIGQFELELGGVRYAMDMGRDDYSLDKYFWFGSVRENYYVNRAEGHNVYVINPDDSPGQYFYASSEIKTLEKKPQGVIYNIDMTPAYIGQVKQAQRGYMLTDNRKVFVVQDEIQPAKANDEFYWFWHTEANIEIVDNNHIILSRNGKQADLYLDSNVLFTVESGLSEPLATSPEMEGQLLAYGKVNKLTVRFRSTEDKIYFRAICKNVDTDYQVGDIEEISEWFIPDIVGSGRYEVSADTVSEVPYGITADEFLSNIISVDTDKYVEKDGVRLEGNSVIPSGAVLKLVSDSIYQVYNIQFIPPEYKINKATQTITGVQAKTPCQIFKDVTGATFKNTGYMTDGMKVTYKYKSYVVNLKESIFKSDFNSYSGNVTASTTAAQPAPDRFDQIYFPYVENENVKAAGVTKDNRKALNVTANENTSQDGTIQMFKFMSPAISEQLVELSFSFMAEDLNGVFSMDGRNSYSYSIIKFDSNGFINAFGAPVAMYDAGAWYDVRVIFDPGSDGRYELYINDERIVSGYSTNLFYGFESIKAAFTYKKGKNLSMWIDDVALNNIYG